MISYQIPNLDDIEGSVTGIFAPFRAQFKLQAVVFDLTTNKKFDMAIMLFIGLNMLIMSMDHYNMTKTYELVLERLNIFFIAIFTAECVLKIFALRWYYFKDPWSMFDFVVVVLSILGEYPLIRIKARGSVTFDLTNHLCLFYLLRMASRRDVNDDHNGAGREIECQVSCSKT